MHDAMSKPEVEVAAQQPSSELAAQQPLSEEAGKVEVMEALAEPGDESGSSGEAEVYTEHCSSLHCEHTFRTWHGVCLCHTSAICVP